MRRTTSRNPAARHEEPVVEIGEDWNEPTAAESAGENRGMSGDRTLDIADESGQTLQDHLNWQLMIAGLPAAAEMIGQALVDAINDDGYLTESLEDIALALRPELEVGSAEVESVLRIIQQLDPAGIGARSLSECVEIQLRQLDPGDAGAGSCAATGP